MENRNTQKRAQLILVHTKGAWMQEFSRMSATLEQFGGSDELSTAL